MPQMSPLWWEILFMIFFLIFIIFNIVIYFNQESKLTFKPFLNIKTDNNLNWTW
uniref:ATP synthase F0 subunit 8 n=1 Tax=Eocanthecona concinna TaxID=3110672 RepID=UPI002E76E3EA|nr:ATP synthase F0 subunit 8 [Eocanthecona concinna]WRB04595.1 ATP synthase F0 subunit 8 [Eocanthecona concinna]